MRTADGVRSVTYEFIEDLGRFVKPDDAHQLVTRYISIWVRLHAR